MKNNFYRLLLLPLLLLAAWGARAQVPVWQNAYPIPVTGPSSNSVVQGVATNAAGDIFIAGSFTGTATFGSTALTSTSGTEDMFVAKWNGTANTWAWAVSGGGAGTDQAFGIAVNGNNVYVCGNYSNSTATISGSSLAAYNTDGTLDMYVAKYYDNGTSVTSKGALRGGGASSDRANAIAINSSTGTVYVTGYLGTGAATISGSALSSAGAQDIFVARYTDAAMNASSNLAEGGALRAGGTSTGEQGYGIAVNSSGTIYVTGTYGANGATFSSGTTLSSSGSRDMFLARYTDSGSALAFSSVVAAGGTGADFGFGITTSGTTVYVAGYYASPTMSFGNSVSLTNAGGTTGSNDMLVVKYTDTNGTLTANSAAGSTNSTGDDSAYGVAVVGTAVYVTGNYNTSATISGTALTGQGGTDGFLAKYTDSGSLTPNGAISGGGTGFDQGRAIAPLGSLAVVAGTVDPSASSTFGATTIPAGSEGFFARVGAANTTVTSIVPAAANPTNASSVTFTVTFAASVSGLTTSNFTTANGGSVTGSGVTSVTAVSGTVYTVTVNTGSGSGTLGLTLANDTGLTPGISNEPFTGTPLYSIDKTAPTVTAFTSSNGTSGSTTATTPLSYSVTFSESVTGFSAADITVTNGTVTSGPTGSSSGPYTFTVTPTTSGTVTNVTIAANVVQDAVGNGNTASGTYSLTYQQPLVANSQPVTVQLDANGNGTLAASGVNNGSTGPGTLTYTIQKIAFGYIPESTTPLTLTTPNGANFTQIRFASYGTPNNNTNGNYSLGPCNAANSLAAAQNAYVGRSSGSMYASNTDTRNNPVLGDPCGGTPKFLAVQAAYSPDAASLTYNCTEAGKTQYVLLTVSNGSTSSTSVAQVTVTPPPTATLTSASPNPATPGTTVTVGGTNLSGLTSLTVNGATAAISGLTSTGFTFVVPSGATLGNGTISVTAPCAQTVTRAFAVQAPTITLAPAALPDGTVGTAYSQPIAASGGTAPYSYAITAGALPAGLTLASNGTLSGTPTAGGSFTFTVTATDASTGSGPYTGSRSYTLTIAAPTITVAPTTLPNGATNTAYSQSLTAAGGTAPYSYAITAGALPAGLTLASNG
ncbi:putative Ig domain-containing protein, partial [Hymenobacter sp. M29]